jgi:GNAT superfamily N-acetyltransferase
VTLLRAVHEADNYPMIWQVDADRWIDPPDLLGAWVAELDGALVGHLLLGPIHQADILPGTQAVEAMRLFVHPSRRGLGIAAALLRAAITCAGDRPVVLVVVDGTPAVAAYQRLGWKEITRHRADWTIGPDQYPELIWYQAP